MMRLIDADKLIAQLKRYTWNMDADDAGYAMAIHDLLQDIDSQDTVQPTVNPWISVKERLPEPGERVLYCYHGFVGEGYVTRSGEWERAGIWTRYYPSHWMPLPEPPKEGGGEE